MFIDLEMGVNIICTLKNRRKTRFVDLFFFFFLLPKDLSRRARGIAGDVS